MPAGRPAFKPTDEQRNAVQLMAGSGSFTRKQICMVIGCDEKTLAKNFVEELENSEAKLNAKVTATMFRMASSGEHPGMTAFWMKCRMRWKEVQEIQHTGGITINITAEDAAL